MQMPVDSGEAYLCTQVVWNTGGRDILATSPDSPPGLCPKDLVWKVGLGRDEPEWRNRLIP